MKSLKRMNDHMKALDYKRYAHLLLLVSVFFYFGVVISHSQKAPLQLAVMMVSTGVFLGGAAIFYAKSLTLKKTEYEDIDL